MTDHYTAGVAARFLKHAAKLRKIAAQLSVERVQGWANPLVADLSDIADDLEGKQRVVDTGDAVLSALSPAPAQGSPDIDLIALEAARQIVAIDASHDAQRLSQVQCLVIEAIERAAPPAPLRVEGGE